VRPFLERLFESPANLSGHNHDHHGHSHGGSCCAHEHGDEDGHGPAHGAAPLAPAVANSIGQSHGKLQLPVAPKARDNGHEHDDCCGH